MNIHAMSNEDYARVLEAAPMIRGFLKAVEEEALSKLMKGETIPGFKVLPGRTTRNWTVDEEKLVPKLVRLGIPKKELYTQEFVTPAKLEKLKWVNKKGEDCKLSKNQIELINKEYVVKFSNSKRVGRSDEYNELIDKGPDVSSLFNKVI